MHTNPDPPSPRRARLRCLAGVMACAAALSLAPTAWAQSPDGESLEPAFTLATSRTFTTTDDPVIHLTFRGLSSLDFRVYRVNDVRKFFAGLRDPHALGGPDAVIPEEQSWLERIARWKARRRADTRAFLRRQFSREYRVARRARADQDVVRLRQTVGYASFAQVPLLNRSQLVESWREILPLVRDAEARRIPLSVRDPGVYVIEAVNGLLKAYTILIRTDIGMVTKGSPGEVVVFTANRATGAPVTDCDVDIVADQRVVATARTGADGLARLALGEVDPEGIVSVAACPGGPAAADPGTWYVRSQPREFAGYLYTDKPIYRPGHTVHLKGVLRWRVATGLTAFDRDEVEVVITDPNDKVIARRSVAVSDYGTVQASVEIPAGAALGYYSTRVNSDTAVAYGSFEVQEYRRPEFDVTVTPATPFAVQGDTALVSVSARYYFGQPVSDGFLTYGVYHTPYWSPLRWTDSPEDSGDNWYGSGIEVGQFQARLDASGEASLRIPLPPSPDGRDYAYRIEARVTDSSGREVIDDARVYATAGTFLLSTSADRYLFRPGDSPEFRVRAVSYQGEPQPDVSVQARLERLHYDPTTYGPPRVELIAETNLETGPDGRAVWTTALPTAGGSYRFLASAQGERRAISDETSLWIPGEAEVDAFDDFTRVLELVADRRTYQPGDTARLMVRGERFETAMLLTKEAQHVTHHEVVQSRDNEVIEVPITEDDVGGTYVNVVFLKDDRLYRAERRLEVPPSRHQLTVELLPDEPTGTPGALGQFTVRTTDASGRPVQAQLSLGVVDEAVYAIKDDTTADPLRFFYRQEYSRVGTQYSREYSFVGFSGSQQLLLAQRRRPFQLADFKAGPPPRPHVRKDFPDAIFWVADLETDDRGEARVQFSYPDALTTWRLTGRAVTRETSLGVGVTRTRTTKDLIVRVVAPRFLTQGDAVDIPTIVHSYLDGTTSVATTVEVDGLTADATPEPWTVDLATGAEARRDIRFTADRVGDARVTATSIAATDGDAVSVVIPVNPHGLARETHATGVLRDQPDAVIPIEIPANSNPASRTLRLALAPSLAGTVFSALDMLTSFPYGCTEQILSSFVPTLMVRRTMTTLGLPITERLQAIDRQVSDGLRRLYEYQHDDGGWGWWRTDPNHPFMTAYALDGLLEVRRAGYRVEDWRLHSAAGALAGLYAEHPRAVPDLKAYISYVLARAAEPLGIEDGNAAGRLDELWTARGRLSAYGQALLVLTLDARGDARAAELAAALLSQVRTEGDLAWWDSPADPLLFDLGDTSVEATAFAVKALAGHQPPSDLLERAVRWLLLNRNRGVYWSSTKQTAMVLDGLLDYMASHGETASPFEIDVHINGTLADTIAFGPDAWTQPDPHRASYIGNAGDNDVRLTKRGTGTLYWSAGASYHDDGPRLDRTGSRELAVVRRYLKLEPIERNGRVVYRESPVSGDLQVGDLVLVRLSVAGSTDWRYLALEDPIPAGAEAVRGMESYSLETRVAQPYESRREYRDDRVAIFLEDLSAGRYELAYLLKLTTPGTFQSMPAQISPMYVPDVSASSDAYTFRIVNPAESDVAVAAQPEDGR